MGTWGHGDVGEETMKDEKVSRFAGIRAQGVGQEAVGGIWY
jgi:hypothetical protein